MTKAKGKQQVRVTLALGSGKAGTDMRGEVESHASRLKLRNAKGEPNVSAVFLLAYDFWKQHQTPENDATSTPQN